MTSAGRLTEMVAFYRLNDTTDEYGNVTSGYEAVPFWEGRGELMVASRATRERMEAGRLAAAHMATLRVRREGAVEAVIASDKAVINGVEYQIRSEPITQGLRDRFVEFELERGVIV